MIPFRQRQAKKRITREHSDVDDSLLIDVVVLTRTRQSPSFAGGTRVASMCGDDEVYMDTMLRPLNRIKR
ncbi:unnamed protein product [Sphagnum balticum]